MTAIPAALPLSSHAWLPATDRAGNVRPLCDRHTSRLLAHVKRPDGMVTVWQCLICGGTFEVVEVPA